MESEVWKRLEDLWPSVLEVEPERRDEFLVKVCGEDSELLNEFRSLLASHGAARDFLQTPAAELAAHVLASEEEVLLSRSLEGQQISHYRILKRIGRGGMGTVWLAERCDGRFERKVAIKFLNVAALDEASAERFRREGAMLGRLAHPQIAELMDAGLTSTGEPFLVIEYVEGRPIDEHCDLQKLGVNARIRLFLDVLRAAAHAHSHLIVHRDIKPSNVLVSNHGQVKLLDFGIAKALADETGDGSATLLTLEGGAALTPRFAAPEQVTAGTITVATDIYSLGTLLYLLLTGQHPAGAGPHSPAELMKAIVDGEPRPVSGAIGSGCTDAAANRGTTLERLRRQLRGDLDRIVAKAVKKNPAERYASASAFADDLERYLEHKPVLAQHDSFGYRTVKFVRRNRVGVAVAVTALVATFAGLTAILIQDRRVREERNFAFRELARTQQHDDFLDFLLSDAGPSGKPFTVDDLLGRATSIVEKQKASPIQVELLDWIGTDYASLGQYGQAKPILEHAYQLSRQFNDPDTRASASCTLALALSEEVVMTRAEALIQEGLRELPDNPQYAFDRITCLDYGGDISLEMGDAREAVRRKEMARRILRASALDSDALEMSDALDLASAYSDVGRDRESLAEFSRASALMSSLGRDGTQTAVQLYNGWGQELDQVGRPLEAEKLYRRAIEISRDNSAEDGVSSSSLDNYAGVERELNHLTQAADYAERAYKKALQTEDELMICQSLLDRARVYRTQHDLARAGAMLDQVEPRLLKDLPSGHYGLSTIPTERGLIALEKHDLPTALRMMDQAIAIIQAAVKANGGGSFALPGLYVRRSEVDLAMGHASDAEADAEKALSALHADPNSPEISSRVGQAYLAQARALESEGKAAQAHTAASQALAQLQGSIGPDHPDTKGARELIR
jgi:eukaryotic-like serine/threonine-protein kinase